MLLNARYSVYLYETEDEIEDINMMYISLLQDAYDIAEDEFYVKNTPGQDWNYHRIRCLEYMGQCTECGNSRGFSKKECSIISDNLKKLLAKWDEDPEGNGEILPRVSIQFMLTRNMYFAGEKDLEEYREDLRNIISEYRNDQYDFNSVFPNLVAPLELVITYEGQERFAEAEKEEIIGIYTWIIEYVSKGKNDEAFSLLLEYFTEFIYHFVEVPGGISFEQMGLYCMAALHPPTYIHSRMIGELAKCICENLMEYDPGLFAGVCGCGDGASVTDRKEEIIEFCYHAGLCHDFGKIPMIDTIFVYGRNLLDHEFSLLKHHTRVGALLLESHESTCAYAGVALGHHKWFDDSRGYPEEYESAGYGAKIITDIVTVADCLDAATDTAGRSYTGSKTPEIIMDEIAEGGGNRYNPHIANLLRTGDLRDQVSSILKNVRRDTSRKTYDLLTGLTKDS